jgi:hypothetical protein
MRSEAPDRVASSLYRCRRSRGPLPALAYGLHGAAGVSPLAGGTLFALMSRVVPMCIDAGPSGGAQLCKHAKGRTMETVMAVGLASLVACSAVAVRNALV